MGVEELHINDLAVTKRVNRSHRRVEAETSLGGDDVSKARNNAIINGLDAVDLSLGVLPRVVEPRELSPPLIQSPDLASLGPGRGSYNAHCRVPLGSQLTALET